MEGLAHGKCSIKKSIIVVVICKRAEFTLRRSMQRAKLNVLSLEGLKDKDRTGAWHVLTADNHDSH